MTLVRWAIAFVTMDRPTAAHRFVRAARRRFPEVPIYVADQSATIEPMPEFYAAEQVTLLRMPFDSGLSACRNALVEAMAGVDYFALCDDDFVLGPATAFTSALAVLEADDTLGVVGGMLHDYDGSVERVRNWEMFLDHDARHGRFTAVPIYNYSPIPRSVAGETIYACDAVLNFAVFRRSLFSAEIRWDERIKINGEHEDFYLTLKTRSPHRVAYLPRMAALHHPLDLHGRYARLRSREAGWAEFMHKWHLTSQLEVGTGGRPLDGSPVAEWFDTGAEGGPLRSRFLGAPGPPETRMSVEADPYQPFIPWLVPEVSVSQPVAAGRLSFCYQPLTDPDGYLLAWYRVEGDAPGPSDNGGIVARWFSSSAEVLAWDSEAQPLRGGDARYWQPLAFRIPLWPWDADYLRFELAAAGPGHMPLAMGYVFADRAAEDRCDPLPSMAARALIRTTTAAADGLSLPPQPLAVLVAAATREVVSMETQEDVGMAMLDISGLDFVVIAAEPPWPALFMAAGAADDGHAPSRIAVPLDLLRAPRTVLLACRPGRAQERLTVLDPRPVLPAAST